jgi:hypothetical protein
MLLRLTGTESESFNERDTAMSGATKGAYPRTPARGIISAFLAVALSAAALATVTPVASAAEGESPLTLGGTISTTRTVAVSYTDPTFSSVSTYGPESVTYTGVRTVSTETDPDGTQRALLTADSVSIEQQNVVTSSDSRCEASRVEYDYSYSGSLSGLTGVDFPWPIAWVAVTPSGDVSYHPYLVPFTADGVATGCGFSIGVKQGFDAGSYQPGNAPEPRGTIADTDPSPDRIAASASYGLDSLPFDPAVALRGMTAYSYTVDLDLRVGEPADSCGPDEVDSDGDGIADACEPLEAVNDDGLVDDSFVTVYEDGRGMLFDVLANDIGDDIRVVDANPLGHDEGTVQVSPSGVTWAYTNPPPGNYQFTYTIRDRYRRESSATVTVRVDCAANNKVNDTMQWTAGIDAGLDLYVLDADVTYCKDDGNITAFELTPSTTDSSILGFLGFDLKAGDVSYSPPRDTYPAMTVSGTVRFDMCYDPASLLLKLGGKTIDRIVTREVDRQLERNLRKSGEWTAESFRLGLSNARDGLLKEVAREIRRVPGLRGESEKVVLALVDDVLRTAINTAISQVLDAAGPAGIYGMSPDEAAVWATRELLSQIPQACARVWEPEVELEGRPNVGPLAPSPPRGYVNPLLVVRLTY